MKEITIKRILTAPELLFLRVKEVGCPNYGLIIIPLLEPINFHTMTFGEIKKKLYTLADHQSDEWLKVIIRGCFWVYFKKNNQVFWVDEKYIE
ncbi:hypothetical protein [Methanosphaera sp.]|jgi:hypothetical protein|uniref:hypothetical protein n=1 Tax=Methanosphaera sp. TaxID=2666342 RepID=UPI003D930B97